MDNKIRVKLFHKNTSFLPHNMESHDTNIAVPDRNKEWMFLKNISTDQVKISFRKSFSCLIFR